jgi:hypothetical protein
MYVEHSLDDKKNPKEVIKTLSELINHVAENYFED